MASGEDYSNNGHLDIDNMEASYIGKVRNRLLRRFEIDRDVYLKYIGGYLGKEYAEKIDFAFESNNDEVGKDGVCDEYLQGFLLQEHMDGSLRASTASVYTPEPIAAYLVKRGLFYVMEEDFIKEGLAGPDSEGFSRALGKILKLKPYRAIRIMDISAGTGLFFLKLLQLMEKALKTCRTPNEIIDEILLKQINKGFYANDLHKEGLELFLIGLLNRFLDRYAIDEINPTIFSSSAVSDFDFGNSYDLFLGNPPYLGEKGNRAIFKKARASEFGKRFYEAKMDYLYYFIYKAVDLLKPGGVLSYITTNYFTTADGAKKLRAFLNKNTSFREIFILEGIEIFSSAKGQHNMIFTIQKKPAYSDKIVLKKALINSVSLKDSIKSFKMNEILEESIYDIDGNIVLYEDSLYGEVSRTIRKNSECLLGDLCQVRQGLVSGCDKTNRRNIMHVEKHLQVNEPIFVFDSPEALPKGLKYSPFLKPLYKNSDIGRYTLKDSKKLVLYVSSDKMENEGKEQREAVLNHLSRYREILSRRREVLKGARQWYELQWYRSEEIFLGPKLMVPHRAVETRFVYTEKPCYASADIYFIHSKNETNIMKALCCILNSSLVYFWFKNNGKRKGKQLELYYTPLNRIPIPKLTEEAIEKLSSMHDCPDRDDEAIDEYVYGLYGLCDDEKETIRSFAEREITKRV